MYTSRVKQHAKSSPDMTHAPVRLQRGRRGHSVSCQPIQAPRGLCSAAEETTLVFDGAVWGSAWHLLLPALLCLDLLCAQGVLTA